MTRADPSDRRTGGQRGRRQRRGTTSGDDQWSGDRPGVDEPGTGQHGTDLRGVDEPGTGQHGTDLHGGDRRGGDQRPDAGPAGRGRRRESREPAAPRDPATTARDICLRLLALRPYTRAELDTALRRRGIPDDVISEVLDRYSDVGMIDDEAFARAWVSSRHHAKGLAARALAGELRRKGVAPELVGAALDDLDDDTVEATARALVERRLRVERAATGRSRPRSGAAGSRRTVGDADDGDGADGDLDRDVDMELDADSRDARAERRKGEAALVRRLIGMLARKGYQPGLAYRVVREALAEEADPDSLAELDSVGDDLGDVDQLRS